MPKVFVTQIPARLEAGVWMPTLDVSPAKEWGEVVVLLPSGQNFHAVTDAVTGALDRLATEFDEQVDFYLPMGDTMVMIAGAACLGQCCSRFNMLKRDRHTRSYHSYNIVTPIRGNP